MSNLNDKFIEGVLEQVDKLDDMGGPEAQDYVDVLEAITKELRVRINNCKSHMPKPEMSETSRNWLKETLASGISEMASECCDSSVGWDGLKIQGVNEMSDIELIEEYCSTWSDYCDEIKVAISEICSDAMLKNIRVPEFDTTNLQQEEEDDYV